LAVGAITVIVRLVMLWRDANSENTREKFAFAVLATYGLISCTSLLGSWALAYLQLLLRSLLLLYAVGLDRAFTRYELSRGRSLLLGIGRPTAALAALVFAYMFAIVPGATDTLSITIPHVVRDHVIRGVGPGYAGMWPETLRDAQAVIDARRDSSGKPPTLWSTYAGLLEARNGMFHPTVDYVIHALGPANRVKYVEDFRRFAPRLAQTVRPGYTGYEAWIEDTSWDFYVELLRNYQLVRSTPWSFFWERVPQPAPPPSPVWSGSVAAGADSVVLPIVPTSSDGSGVMLLQVEIDYKIRNPLHVLPVIGALPRYFVRSTEALQAIPVTIDPYTTTTRFPLLALRGKAPVLHWTVESLLPGAHIDVTAARLSVVQTTPGNQPWLAELVQSQVPRD